MQDLTEYIEAHTTPETPALSRITFDTNLHILNPHMLSGPIQGELLRMLSRMIRPHKILELGTFTGYSAICLAEGLTDDPSSPTPASLITIEHNDELEDTILRNLSACPNSNRIHLIIGDAKHVIANQLQDSLFDLVFIDADKREYATYFDLIFPLVRPGGFILADNTLWDGHIIDPAYDHDKQTCALRYFNDKIKDDPRVSQVILPLRDGLSIIYKHPI